MGIWESIADTSNASRGFVKQLYKELQYSIREELKSYNREKSKLKNEIENLKTENNNLKLIITAILRKSIEKGIFTQEELATSYKEIDIENIKADGQYYDDIFADEIQEENKPQEIKIDFSDQEIKIYLPNQPGKENS
ncbi:MAG: hypothetical protein AAF349_14800 [Cyanobacteria bacterium P01_A01_bin.68]